MGLFTNNKKLCPICGSPTPRLLASAVEGQNLAIRQPGKELCQHPRLLFSKQEEQRVRDLFGTEPLLDSLRASLMREAERLLLVPPQEDPRRK